MVHVIGDGENRETFLEKLKSRGLEAEYYGAVYDEEAKRRILEKCGFGINMMTETVQVGLTMKSIDYFCCGLPLINTTDWSRFLKNFSGLTMRVRQIQAEQDWGWRLQKR